MKINRTRPVMAFILVAVVCGIVIAQGLRASALTVVVSGRAPAAFAGGLIPGALFGPVFTLRVEPAPVIRPVLTDRAEPSTASVVASRRASVGSEPARAVAAVAHASSAVARPSVVPVKATPAKVGPVKPSSGAKVRHTAHSRGDQTVRAQSSVDRPHRATTSGKARAQAKADGRASKAKAHGKRSKDQARQDASPGHVGKKKR